MPSPPHHTHRALQEQKAQVGLKVHQVQTVVRVQLGSLVPRGHRDKMGPMDGEVRQGEKAVVVIQERMVDQEKQVNKVNKDDRYVCAACVCVCVHGCARVCITFIFWSC